MTKKLMGWHGLLALLLLVGLGLVAFRSLSFDRRHEIAMALLFKPEGGADEPTFSAAFAARFPNGSNPKDLSSFVSTMNGKCARTDQGAMVCTLYESGTFCVGTNLHVEASIGKEGTIDSVRVTEFFVGC